MIRGTYPESPSTDEQHCFSLGSMQELPNLSRAMMCAVPDCRRTLSDWRDGRPQCVMPPRLISHYHFPAGKVLVCVKDAKEGPY